MPMIHHPGFTLLTLTFRCHSGNTGDVFENILHANVGALAPTFANCQTIATQADADFTTALASLYNTDTLIDGYKAALDDGITQQFAEFATLVPGTNGGNILPQWVTQNVKLFAQAHGRKRFGRLYFAGCVENTVDFNKVDAVTAIQLAVIAGKVLAGMTAGSLPHISYGLYSRAADIVNQIVAIGIDPYFRRQDRRYVGRGI